MSAQQTNVDNIAHNLANANTVGFKMRRAQFQDLLYQNLIQPGAAAGTQTVVPSGLQIGLGARTSSNEIIFTQGSFLQTNNPLDLVIEGRGFFQVRRPTGEIAYTRAGQFQLNRDGVLVTGDGDPIEPQITIPAEAQAVTIAQDGTVSFSQSGQAAAQLAGQLQLATFVNPAGMNMIGRNLMQGYVEQSNVSVVEEFINLITSQRAYEANSKVVRAADEMYQQINNITR
jgi:flagellar basal-body rod protein FlgG